MKTYSRSLIVLLILTLLSACGAMVQTDGKSAVLDATVLYDSTIYSMDVEVVGDINNQQTGSYGRAGGSGYAIDSYVSGSTRYLSESTGKGMLQVRIISGNAPKDFIGQVVVIKTTDLKFMALQSGDRVEIKCRIDYESVGATVQNEEIDQARYNQMLTREFDLCRMNSPLVRRPEE